MATLLIIDMQTAWLSNTSPRFNKELVIENINLAAKEIRKSGGTVIHIRHSNDEAPVASAQWQTDARIEIEATDHFIDKTACDSFADTKLLDLLATSNSKSIYICGLATEFCVDSTLRSALSHGFDVIALGDAHTTGDRPHLSAENIVKHHNWVWENLAAPENRRVEVKTVAQAFSL